MAVTLNDAEYFADTISERVEQLINERNMLRQELARNSDGNLEHNKEFVRAYQDNVILNASSNEKITKLEYLLTLNN